MICTGGPIFDLQPINWSEVFVDPSWVRLTRQADFQHVVLSAARVAWQRFEEAIPYNLKYYFETIRPTVRVRLKGVNIFLEANFQAYIRSTGQGIEELVVADFRISLLPFFGQPLREGISVYFDIQENDVAVPVLCLERPVGLASEQIERKVVELAVAIAADTSGCDDPKLILIYASEACVKVMILEQTTSGSSASIQSSHPVVELLGLAEMLINIQGVENG